MVVKCDGIKDTIRRSTANICDRYSSFVYTVLARPHSWHFALFRRLANESDSMALERAENDEKKCEDHKEIEKRRDSTRLNVNERMGTRPSCKTIRRIDKEKCGDYFQLHGSSRTRGNLNEFRSPRVRRWLRNNFLNFRVVNEKSVRPRL